MGSLTYIYGREARENEKVVPLEIAEAFQQQADELRAEIRRLRGEHMPQRQDSLVDQMRDVIPLATKAGCYDAADYLRRIVERRL